jgi:hypothetical protein
MSPTFDLTKFNIKKFDEILERGLSSGLGTPEDKVCIEAAICMTLGLPHGDDPGCVSRAIRAFKISLNDKTWSSPRARAAGLRDLGIAQLGSKGIIADTDFVTRFQEKAIRIFIPAVFREFFPENKICLEAALRCETEASIDAVEAAASAADSIADKSATRYFARVAFDASKRIAQASIVFPEEAADAFTRIAAYLAEDKYLILLANLALEVLRELKSPGVTLLEKQ